MKQGEFYFVTDEYFAKYDTGKKLMQNKEGQHHRPCYFVFPDRENEEILWCIPVSSKVEKFEKIADKKVAQQKARGKKGAICNTICFGTVLGEKRAFLIQNMFPITSKYIKNKYIDRNTNNAVTIPQKEQRIIYNNARDVLGKVFHGWKNLVFSDVIEAREKLLEEIALQIEKEAIAAQIIAEAERETVEMLSQKPEAPARGQHR